MNLIRPIHKSIFLLFLVFPFSSYAGEFLDSFGYLRADSNTLLSCSTDGVLLKTSNQGEITAYPKPKKKAKKLKKKRKKLKKEIVSLTASIQKLKGTKGQGLKKLKKKRKKKKAKRKLLQGRIAFINNCTKGKLLALSTLEEEASIFYDARGIPHVRAISDDAAFYGLGYAQAKLRPFQLFFQRARIQGRLAEYMGPQWGTGPKAVNLIKEDKNARLHGWVRRAEQVYGQLDTTVRGYLDAFAQGVNDAIADHFADELPAPFGSIGVDTFEPWKGVDCLVAYIAISSHFTGGEGGELSAQDDFESDVDALGEQGAFNLWTEESQLKDWDSAIIQTDPQLKMSQVNSSGLASYLPDTLKASHNWVVAGTHNTSGKPVMVGMPMLALDTRWLIEAQIDSPSFHVHGVLMVGTPGFLLGYTPSTSWSVTALNSDLADLFKLKSPAQSSPDTHYRLDGVDEPFDVREEVIQVLGGSSIPITVHESYFGPVVAEDDAGGKYALKHIILSDLDDGRVHPLEGMLALAKATTLTEMKEATWRLYYPALHVLYATNNGSSTGGIGYRPSAALPIRSQSARLQGIIPQDGSSTSNDWQGFYSEQATPYMHNPESGYIVTANGLPTDDVSIYGYKAVGTTERGWRARTLLQQLFDQHAILTPEEISNIRFDCGLELAESVRTLANYFIEYAPSALPAEDDAFLALSYLNLWDGSLDSFSKYAPLARVVRSVTRNKEYFIPTAMNRDHTSPSAFFRSLQNSTDIYSVPEEYIDDAAQWIFSAILPTAWELVNSAPNEAALGFGSDPQSWNNNVKKTISIPYLQGVTLQETLHPAFDIETPRVVCPSSLTLHSQKSNFYTQITHLGDMNATKAAIAPGNSDNPASPFFASEVNGFIQGEVSLAPVDRLLVENTCVSFDAVGCFFEKPLYDPS